MIDILEEGDGVREYLESGTNKYIYMEGSKFEEEAQKEAKKKEKLKKENTVSETEPETIQMGIAELRKREGMKEEKEKENQSEPAVPQSAE